VLKHGLNVGTLRVWLLSYPVRAQALTSASHSSSFGRVEQEDLSHAAPVLIILSNPVYIQDDYLLSLRRDSTLPLLQCQSSS